MKSIGTTKVEVFNKPIVYTTRAIIEQIEYFVSEMKEECQWWHRVKRITHKDAIIYELYDMYIPEQVCSASEVESTEEAFTSLAKEVKEQVGGYNDEFNTIIKTMSVWCHSHVNMSPNPSGTDISTFNSQIKDLPEDSLQPQIMWILNKRSEYYMKIYDPVLGVMFENVGLVIKKTADFSYINDALKNKIKIAEKPKVMHQSVVNRSQGLHDMYSDWRFDREAIPPEHRPGGKKNNESTEKDKSEIPPLNGTYSDAITSFTDENLLKFCELLRKMTSNKQDVSAAIEFKELLTGGFDNRQVSILKFLLCGYTFTNYPPLSSNIDSFITSLNSIKKESTDYQAKELVKKIMNESAHLKKDPDLFIDALFYTELISEIHSEDKFSFGKIKNIMKEFYKEVER